MPPKPYRWVRPDVMPLFAAVAVGIGAVATITTRKLLRFVRHVSDVIEA